MPLSLKSLSASITGAFRNLPSRVLIELGAVLLWAILVGKNLLNLSAYQVPNGGEFSNLVQSHFIWTLLPRCGICFLWNGFLKGGAPALADLSAAILHPLVFLPALLFGVVNGAKVTIIAGLALAGIAQWGLAYRLKLGMPARMWSAMLMVAGGHLTGKMENGNVALIVGQASAALALMFGVDLLFNRNRKALVGLAVALALVILSGEGYIQVAVGISSLPMLALFLVRQPKEDAPSDVPDGAPAWKDYLLALGLALLLAGIFLAPMLHLLPEMYKDGDPGLGNFPPLEYAPLNLVIHDMDYYLTDVLGKDPYPYSHVLYIGWIPVLLAFPSARLTPARLKRLFWVFCAGIALVFLFTTNDLPNLLLNYLPFITKLRHLPVTTGLAVPLILTLAAISADELLKSRALHFSLSSAQRVLASGSVERAVLIPVLVLSLLPVFSFSQEFFGTHDTGVLATELDPLKTSSAEWVNPPYGHYDWTTAALAQGIKIAVTWRPWGWTGHDDPVPVIETTFLPDQQPTHESFFKTEIYAYSLTDADEYAFAEDGPGGSKTACKANSQGGWIDVTCPAKAKGILTVQENNFSGWYAWADGRPVPLLPTRWLQVRIPEGVQAYRFRYLPWDVPFGLLLTLLGVFLGVRCHRRVSRPVEPRDQAS